MKYKYCCREKKIYLVFIFMVDPNHRYFFILIFWRINNNNNKKNIYIYINLLLLYYLLSCDKIYNDHHSQVCSNDCDVSMLNVMTSNVCSTIFVQQSLTLLNSTIFILFCPGKIYMKPLFSIIRVHREKCLIKWDFQALQCKWQLPLFSSFKVSEHCIFLKLHYN